MNIFTGTLATLSLLVLLAVVMLNGGVAGVLVFRRHENKRADYAFALLLVTYALTSLHHIFILRGVYNQHPEWCSLPLYFTLAFGALLFFSVKLRLFPGYRFTGPDVKHLVLPVGQFCYFLGTWLLLGVPVERRFYSPFYGGLEMALYIFTFYTYQFAAYRFIRFKISALRKQQEGGPAMYETLVLRRMLRVMLLLFWVNSAYIVTDFVMYELLRLNMHDFRGFTRFGELSFAAMAGWAGLSGVQLLLKPPYLNLSTLVFSWAKRKLGKDGK
ncbi:MAG: hypothetical protein HY842_17305 [Bacteroidetes bacterium]|nr:hypothetical protein [Bacteroidota bacterium]